ncbi:hypothetical protein ARTSIC4J27_4261 [Pseudarthrobacter siccitolerans]|uniref:Uncharacterized protein n=1 Tax=Pseudarthrobacter siccitolerans TaxID=861266 RepID=A0A024H8Y3_9MICC|nr:hypothetical protein ARTSIC4J27_4261 [Pseudarthrobacter siccitolerans]
MSGCVRWPAESNTGVTSAQEEASNQKPGTRMMSMTAPYLSGLTN